MVPSKTASHGIVTHYKVNITNKETKIIKGNEKVHNAVGK